ncbi:hypothetical protein DAI22_11g121901 [Oryza sativa Japonica Group]|nr:hypothetical protein DAI22_11g121901 [Oryza sativa Japonica Group]
MHLHIWAESSEGCAPDARIWDLFDSSIAFSSLFFSLLFFLDFYPRYVCKICACTWEVGFINGSWQEV